MLNREPFPLTPTLPGFNSLSQTTISSQREDIRNSNSNSNYFHCLCFTKVAKKARPPTIPSEGSPASSAPSTPRKSAKAEHIAQEKARLKKLERELSEKLKLYGRQEEKKNNPSASSNKQSQTSECDSADFKRKGTDKNQLPQHSGGVSNSSGYLSEKQEQDSREEHTHNELPGSHPENLQDVSSKDSEASVTVKVSITPEQLERIRTLQVSIPVTQGCGNLLVRLPDIKFI